MSRMLSQDQCQTPMPKSNLCSYWSQVRERLLSIPDWRGFNNPWMPNDEEAVEYSYINLKKNPERYTGYKVGLGVTLVMSSCPAELDVL